MRTVADAVVSLLTRAGTRRYYTVPGESYLELLDAIQQDEQLGLISARHESGAAFMAEADSRMSGVPAVALASRGPGASNLAIGVHTAHYDATPLIVLLGQVASTVRGREAFQEVDLTAFFAPITKWAVTAESADEVPELVARGVRTATSGRPGPVAVAVPGDFWSAAFDAEPPELAAREPVGSERESSVLADRLAAAANPVVIAGGGVAGARSALVDVVERFDLGVYTAFRRQDAFPCDHPNYLGHLGIGTPESLLEPLDSADLLLLVGTRLDEVTSQGYRYPRPGCAVISVGRDTSRADQDTIRETATVLRGLTGYRRGRARDWSEAHARADRYADVAPIPDSVTGVHPARVVSALRRGLPDDVVVTNDAGNFSGFVHRYWRFTGEAAQLAPSVGAMGYAVPAAVGAKFAAPRRTVLATVGDGGVLMTGQEIETAARHNIKIIVVVFQNGLYGTIAMHQARRFGSTPGSDIATVDFVAWANGLGARGIAVTAAEELEHAIALARAATGPVVVSVRTDPDIISPTTRLSELTTGNGETPEG